MGDKKKLLVTASTFPRWENDTEPRFVLDLSKALTEYFDVTCLVPACPEAKDSEVLEGVKVLRYHYFPIHKFETLCYPGAIVPRIKQNKARATLLAKVINETIGENMNQMIIIRINIVGAVPSLKCGNHVKLRPISCCAALGL
ncbi:hypothetical protein [Butyrivibrio proteoclasticus]|uniref:hypothetical protein n=1 Tax=Butyrivibrio proteoclasticus TaxID=43305 RepID=UPI0011605422|nr:hypothetical protein [Butyrivibrio proteoclasticus]